MRCVELFSDVSRSLIYRKLNGLDRATNFQ